jgi:hypothetical protein
MMVRAVFWVILPCKMIVDNHFTRQCNPEDSSEHHTRRRENLKSHTANLYTDSNIQNQIQTVINLYSEIFRLKFSS